MQLMKSSLNFVTGPQQTPRWRRPRRQRGTRENLLSTCRQVVLPVAVSVGKTTCRFAGFRYSDLRSPAALRASFVFPQILKRLSSCFVGVLKKKNVRGETTFSERPPKLDFRWPFNHPVYSSPTVWQSHAYTPRAQGSGGLLSSSGQRAAGSGQWARPWSAAEKRDAAGLGGAPQAQEQLEGCGSSADLAPRS
jgi:hypothetical protein